MHPTCYNIIAFPPWELSQVNLCALARQAKAQAQALVPAPAPAPTDVITTQFCCFLKVNLCIYRTYLIAEHSLHSVCGIKFTFTSPAISLSDRAPQVFKRAEEL